MKKNNLTPEQTANLEKLIAYVESGESDLRFDMSWFTDSRELFIVTNCGTVACFAGHGPAAGIKPLDGEQWPAYSKRCFSQDIAEQLWLFASAWEGTDNTREGACARARFLLEHGLPNNWQAQIDREAPLCYKTEKLQTTTN